MKINSILTMSALMLANSAHANWPTLDNTKVYLTAEIGQQKTTMKSGGFNTAGNFENTNNDKESGKEIEVKVGAAYMNNWRFDIGYRKYDRQEYTTDSFKLSAPTFLYTSKIETKAVMATVYYDFLKLEKLSFYGGAGVGKSTTKISTNDGVVQGSGKESNTAWQVELGADYRLTESLTFDTGFRYVDLGETKIKTQLIAVDFQTGDFTADLSSKEVFLGLRYTF